MTHDISRRHSTTARARTPTTPSSTTRTSTTMPSGSTMLGFWIYLMSDCLIFAVLFATYRRARPQLRRRPVPRPTCSTCRWSRSTRRCCCSPRSPTASPCWRWSKRRVRPTLLWLGGHRPVRRSASSAIELYEFAPPDPRGRRAAAQRLPVRVLHAGGHARAARHLRHRLAGHADGPGRRCAG